MALQTDSTSLLIWRFIAGVGIGVELVTIDTYISEFVPKGLRGRAFAFNQTIQFAVVPVVAFLSYQLVPLDPLGFAGWRWVVMIGSVGALVVWVIRRAVPESPRWLAAHGRMAEAEVIVAQLEARVAAEHGAPLPPIGPADAVVAKGRFSEMFSPAYRGRTAMLVVFQIFQTVGFYGFANWVPTLLIRQGITTTSSLAYTFVIAIAAPFGPAAASLLADRVERKWMIVGAAGTIAVFGLLFSQMADPGLLIFCGVMLTMSSNIMSFSFHAYQAELYPTRIRALRGGLRLLVQPALGRVQRLLHRLLPARFRHHRRIHLHRRQHGDGDAVHRPRRTTGEGPRAGGDLALTIFGRVSFRGTDRSH